MRVLIPDYLWVGNAGDVRKLAELGDLGVEVVVDLAAEEKPAAMPRDWIYCRFAVLDGEGNSPFLLRLAVDTVAALIGAPVKTLVACSAGMSRSVAIAAAAVAKSRDESPDFHLACVASASPADVSPKLWQDILSV